MKINPLILVVEDVALNMALIVSVLRRLLPDAEIIEAVNGQKAVEITEKIRLDLIFMDIQMPVMDGLEATRQIRLLESRHGIKEPVPIVAVTAFTLNHDKEKCLMAGMNDYIPKPINQVVIQKALSRFLSVENDEPLPTETQPEVGFQSDQHFDLNSLHKRTMLEKEDLLQMAREGAQNLRKHLESLSKATEQNDEVQIKRIFHSIKGLAMNLNFTKLGTMAKSSEIFLQKGQAEQSGITQKMKEELINIERSLKTLA